MNRSTTNTDTTTTRSTKGAAVEAAGAAGPAPEDRRGVCRRRMRRVTPDAPCWPPSWTGRARVRADGPPRGRSGGCGASPGSVYPTLQLLEDEGSYTPRSVTAPESTTHRRRPREAGEPSRRAPATWEHAEAMTATARSKRRSASSPWRPPGGARSGRQVDRAVEILARRAASSTAPREV